MKERDRKGWLRYPPLWVAAFLVLGFQLQTSPVHAVSCGFSGSGDLINAASTICTFELTHSNVSQLNGAIDVRVTWTNTASATEFSVQYINNTAGLGTPKDISEFAYQSSKGVLTSPNGITGGGLQSAWTLQSNQNVDGFGKFVSDWQRTDGGYGITSPINFFLSGLVKDLAPNSTGSFFVVHVGTFSNATACSGFVSNGTSASVASNSNCGAPVPEPGSALLLGAGLAGLGLWRRSRKG